MSRREFLIHSGALMGVVAGLGAASAPLRGIARVSAGASAGRVSPLPVPAEGAIPAALVLGKDAEVLDVCGPLEVFAGAVTKNGKELFAPYTVAATVDVRACRLEVADAGQGYPRRQRGEVRPKDGDLAESGRGLAIMHACMDAVTLRSTPGKGTRVVLDKRIDWEAPLARTA